MTDQPTTPAQVAVKPLEWRIWKHGRFEAESIFGLYQTWSGHFRKPGEVRGNRCEDPEAAAQADYEARIRSALIPAPAPVDASEPPVEQEAVAWRDLGGGVLTTPAPVFGSIRIEPTSSKFWLCFSVPGSGHVLMDGQTFDSIEAAKKAAERLLSHPTPVPAVPDDVAGLVAELRVIGCHENGDARCTCGIGMDAADALEAQAAELEQVKAERDRQYNENAHRIEKQAVAENEAERLRADLDQGAKDYCDLMQQRDALHVRVKALEAALRPFVEYVHDDYRKGKATYELVAVDRAGGGLIGAEDLRRARAALQPTGDRT